MQNLTVKQDTRSDRNVNTVRAEIFAWAMFCGYVTVLRKRRIYCLRNPATTHLQRMVAPEYLILGAGKILSGKELIHHTACPDWRPSDVVLLNY